MPRGTWTMRSRSHKATVSTAATTVHRSATGCAHLPLRADGVPSKVPRRNLYGDIASATLGS
jgi:hypothetical protein